MSGQLRRLRGAVGISLCWGVAWAAIFASISILAGFIRPDVIDEGEGPVPVGAIGGSLGLLSGFAFGVLLSFAESGRAIRDIALLRAAAWGGLASAPFPLLTGRADQVFVLCPIGAAVAVAAVAMARSAELRDSTRPTPGIDSILGFVHRSVIDLVTSARRPSA